LSFKNSDTSFQNHYKHALTYYILSPYCTILQIPSTFEGMPLSLLPYPRGIMGWVETAEFLITISRELDDLKLEFI